MNRQLSISTLLLTALLPTLAARASLVITYAEGPNEVNSLLTGTTVFNFNSLATNETHTNVAWSGVGSFDQLRVLAADSYGGAVDPGFDYGSPYSVQGFSGVNTTTLTLTQPHAYFGFWWSAGDANNILDFYNGENLVGHFTTATLLDQLSSTNDYRGNPRDRGLNYGENYAFINFFGQEGTTWDKIVLSNGSGTGFESDNYTDRQAPWSLETDGPMPGHQLVTIQTPETNAVPETGSALLGMLGGMLLLRRRRA